jgi:limonene-1,2-epoxide hydrolase
MTPTELLQAHARAFAARDVEATVALFGANALYEMPLLRGRLVGQHEIRAGLARAFAVMTGCALTLDRVLAAGATALAEGVMDAATIRGPARMPFAMVAVAEGGRLQRLTVHLDARPFRLWSDGPVLAVAP